MIPSVDHSSRAILHRRVASYDEVAHSQDVVTMSAEVLLLEEENESSLVRPLLEGLEYEEDEDDMSLTSLISRRFKLQWKLWLVFSLLVVSGVSNVVLAKLQSLPMYNYPTFLNIYMNMGYVMLCFGYIIPASKLGWFHNSIPRATLRVPKTPFLVMGALDALSGVLQVMATIYLPGTMLVLLPQAAIPLSMVVSRVVLREKFTKYQYLGAVVVGFGILVVLMPYWTHKRAPDYSCQAIHHMYQDDCSICENEFNQEDCQSHTRHHASFDSRILRWERSDDDDSEEENYCEWLSRKESMRRDDFLEFVWSLVMVASCIPMVLSSVYKQVALQVELDPIFLNGWVAFFQLLFAIPLALPAGWIASPSVLPQHLPMNWWQAIQCLFARVNTVESGCHPDDCSRAALWVHLGLLSSACYMLSTIFVLKYGSASTLYMGLTVVVPLGHLVFSLHSPSSVNPNDIVGLAFLVVGLILYRFGYKNRRRMPQSVVSSEPATEPSGGNNSTSIAESEQGNDFLEFLREPFMMVGDV